MSSQHRSFGLISLHERTTGLQSLRNIDGRHAVGGILWLQSELLETKRLDCVLDTFRDLLMDGKTFGKGRL